MWYLIIPPIIVAISLSFILWYLSRKGADPLIAAQASKLEAEAYQQVSFLHTKTFFLHLLEKTAYRFKVASLRMHNALHNLTQSLKESQRRFQPKTPLHESLERPAPQEIVPGKERSAPRTDNIRRFFGRDSETVVDTLAKAASGTEMTLEAPIVRNRKETSQTEQSAEILQTSASEESLPVSRPMVSETATHPERANKRMPANSFREEDFIARIAANPKDFAAYEGLGDYYLEIDNVKDAKECYRQVLRLSPVQRMVKIKIRRLEKILSQKTEREVE